MDKLEFLAKFIKIYGFKSLIDYDTKISANQFKNNKLFFDRINTEMPSIKKFFNISQMSLSKNNYIINTPLQAIQLLKHCLQQENIGFQKIKINTTNYIRLVKPNFLYIDFIKNMTNSNIPEHTPDFSKSQGKEILFDDIFSKLEVTNIMVTNNGNFEHIKFLSDNVENKFASCSYKTEKKIQKISNKYYVRDDCIYILIPLAQYADIFCNIDYKLLNNNNAIIDESLIEINILCDKYIMPNIFPSFCTPYNQQYVLMKFPKDFDTNCTIVYNLDYLYLGQKLRKEMKHNNIIFKNSSIKIMNGVAHSDKPTDILPYIGNIIGTETIRINFTGLQGQFRPDRFYKQISNIKFNHNKNIRWVMTILEIGGQKILYCNEHYNLVPIPLYALIYHDILFQIELSNGLNNDEYLEITFDYDNSNDLPDVNGKELYPDYIILNGTLNNRYVK